MLILELGCPPSELKKGSGKLLSSLLCHGIGGVLGEEFRSAERSNKILYLLGWNQALCCVYLGPSSLLSWEGEPCFYTLCQFTPCWQDTMGAYPIKSPVRPDFAKGLDSL